MSVSSGPTLSFWRTTSTGGYHIYTDESSSSEVIHAIESLSTQPVGSKIQFDVLSPEPAILKRVDADCSGFFSAPLLTIESAEAGVWEVQETEHDITLKVGLPWVAIFARMLNIDGVAFGPADETSKVHIWC